MDKRQAIGFIETEGLPAAIAAADAAVKSANVRMIGRENSRGGGYITIKVTGDVGAVKAAMDAAKMVSDKVHGTHSVLVIPRPAEGIRGMLVWNANTMGVEPPEPPLPPEPPEPPTPPTPPLPPEPVTISEAPQEQEQPEQKLEEVIEENKKIEEPEPVAAPTEVTEVRPEEKESVEAEVKAEGETAAPEETTETEPVEAAREEHGEHEQEVPRADKPFRGEFGEEHDPRSGQDGPEGADGYVQPSQPVHDEVTPDEPKPRSGRRTRRSKSK